MVEPEYHWLHPAEVVMGRFPPQGVGRVQQTQEVEEGGN